MRRRILAGGRVIYFILPAFLVLLAVAIMNPDSIGRPSRRRPDASPLVGRVAFFLVGTIIVYRLGVAFAKQIREDLWRSSQASRTYTVTVASGDRCLLGPVCAEGAGRIMLAASAERLRDHEVVELHIRQLCQDVKAVCEFTFTITPTLSPDQHKAYRGYVGGGAWPVWFHVAVRETSDQPREITLTLDVKCKRGRPQLPDQIKSELCETGS